MSTWVLPIDVPLSIAVVVTPMCGLATPGLWLSKKRYLRHKPQTPCPVLYCTVFVVLPSRLQYGRLRAHGVILKTQKGRDSYAFIDFADVGPAQVGAPAAATAVPLPLLHEPRLPPPLFE